MFTNRKATQVLQILVILGLLLASVFSPVGTSNVAAQSEGPSQDSCHALAEKYGNVAQPSDPEWQECFLAGWVNWVFSSERPLPDVAPDWFPAEGMVQLTEPWRAGCDNTLESPHCSIGFLKVFADWNTMVSFLEMGEFVQANVAKSGPWSEGSIWYTEKFVMVADGKALTASQVKWFCEQKVAMAFATDGEFPLPTVEPCDPDTVYSLREKWQGTCIGDQLPDASCNVGEVKNFDDWNDLLDHLDATSFERGSVFANSDKLKEMTPIVVDPSKVVTYSPFRAFVTANSAWLGLLCILTLIILALAFALIRRRR
ncbi:MAG: hypothetical protein UX64_C0026G0005 [Microgenomates group bacterium GW2011_GWC2_46_7]|nr:MAG: hypothetical protein UX64_C0026G0005 [Microgenomates group bacterium GW2011_GWC2_46_7]